jgi:hypothetical protein
MAYERDFRYNGVYAFLRLSGINEDDALPIARASQSMDENAEVAGAEMAKGAYKKLMGRFSFRKECYFLA